jgi:hypothetical protein
MRDAETARAERTRMKLRAYARWSRARTEVLPGRTDGPGDGFCGSA